jgi:hypothetical protein
MPLRQQRNSIQDALRGVGLLVLLGVAVMVVGLAITALLPRVMR